MGASVVVNQPGVYFVDAAGNVVTADDGTTIANHEGLIIAGKDGTVMRFMRVASDGTLRVDPTGTTTQPVSDAGGSITVDGPLTDTELRAAAVPISAASLPLPTGAATQTTLATLATETKLEAVRALLATIDADTSSLATVDYATQTTLAALLSAFNAEDFASETTLAALKTNFDAEDFASETTLAAADTKLGTIDGVLDSIKDTDGIKKITDELPAGTQEIGAVKQGTKAAGSGAWPTALYNAAGDPVAVILDNSIYRLETRSSIVGQAAGTGAEVKTTVVEDTEDSSMKRLQTEARLAPGSVINIGTAIPANPASLIVQFLEEPGGSEDMLVNGSGTPVVFSYAPPTGEVVALQELLVVFTSDDFNFDGVSYGPNAALTNGIKLEVSIDSVVTEIFNVKQNEDFIRIPGRIPLVNNTGPKDLLGVSFQFGGLIKLTEADGDSISITIRDDLTSVKFKYLTATVYATEDA